MRNAAQGHYLVHRIGDDFVDRRGIVGKPVHERRIGAVLEKAPNEVGKQILMAADGRVDAARLVHAVASHDARIELLTHAMQPLELERFVVARHHG